MQTAENKGYVMRAQKDYSISIKLQVVQEIESRELGRTEACHKYGIQAKSTVKEWLRKYGKFDWENQLPKAMSKTSEQMHKQNKLKKKLNNNIIVQL